MFSTPPTSPAMSTERTKMALMLPLVNDPSVSCWMSFPTTMAVLSCTPPISRLRT